ncbi:MAG: hypothetical protein JW888_18605 [Pirellulales bacterium]|nr:hypothetical protein [Pirellulales bacterium]
MKWLLARIGLPKAIGLYVDEDAITLSQVVATPLGPVEIAHETEPLDRDSLPEVIRRLVEPLLGKGKFRRTPVSVSIPAKRVYFSTRPVHAAMDEESSPHILLREALNTQNISVNDMFVDVIRDEPDAREVASIVACDKSYLADILDALKTMEVYPHLVEPAPCALLRLAQRQHGTRRSAKVVLRLFLSNTQVLTVLVVNRRPLLWRFMQLTQGEEAVATVTACRSLLATSKDCGVESPLDAVVIHGREELKRLLDIDWIENQLDRSVTWHDGPALDSSQIALGISEGGFDKRRDGLDLGRSLRPRSTLLRLFPWREAAMELALVAMMGIFLGYSYWTLRETQQSLQRSIALSPAEITTSKSQFQKEKKELKGEVLAIREFLDTRVLWTSCLRDLSLCVPKDMTLNAVRGRAPYQNAKQRKQSRGKTKDSFVISGSVTVPPSGLVPHEIDRLLVALRSDPTLQKNFPLVTLEELQQVGARGTLLPSATFSIECLPDTSKKSKKKSKEKTPKPTALRKKNDTGASPNSPQNQASVGRQPKPMAKDDGRPKVAASASLDKTNVKLRKNAGTGGKKPQ